MIRESYSHIRSGHPSQASLGYAQYTDVITPHCRDYTGGERVIILYRNITGFVER
ncbi:hypothetical protein [Gilliamella sp. CG33]|uniref:hypothetical protein n=1 Tax=Gilliamella sp. CG33 TaxID=3351506 RepID=UPI003985947B